MLQGVTVYCCTLCTRKGVAIGTRADNVHAWCHQIWFHASKPRLFTISIQTCRKRSVHTTKGRGNPGLLRICGKQKEKISQVSLQHVLQCVRQCVLQCVLQCVSQRALQCVLQCMLQCVLQCALHCVLQCVLQHLEAPGLVYVCARVCVASSVCVVCVCVCVCVCMSRVCVSVVCRTVPCSALTLNSCTSKLHTRTHTHEHSLAIQNRTHARTVSRLKNCTHTRTHTHTVSPFKPTHTHAHTRTLFRERVCVCVRACVKT